jgi:phosphoglycerate dehydrogenase-like enzyme
VTRIAVLDDYQGAASSFADWSSLPADVVFFDTHLSNEDDVATRLTDFDVVAVMRERTPFRESLLTRLPRLKLIVTAGKRNAAIDMDSAREQGIVVAGVGGGPSGSTAELTWALILAVVRHIPAEDARVRAGGWQHTVGTDLAGRTLGVLGLGRLGSQVATVGLAFGMDVIAWSANLTDERAAAVGATRVEKADLFARSDVLSVHTVLSDRTRGLIGAAEFAAMKPTAFLVNTSRGPIVDSDALLKALHDRQIAGAGLDVFDAEPLPAGHPLLQAPNTVLSPHIGFVTETTYRSWYTGMVEAISAFLAGEPVNVLNAPESGDTR